MLSELLEQQPTNISTNSDTLGSQQLADPDLHPIILYLREGNLPEYSQRAQEIITLAQGFTMSDRVPFRMNSKQVNFHR